MKTISWFSAGVSSAVATKLAINEIDEIIYTHIDDQHPDSLRFVKDCEAWFGKPVTILQSPLKSVNNACCVASFICGPHGAACTRLLKIRVRKEYELQHEEILTQYRYAWGMDCGTHEQARAADLREFMPYHEHLFPLIEKSISKEKAHQILKASGIKRPAMYELGYQNNNCVGCVKGGKGYWNKIRVDFPEVFAARAQTERKIGASIISGCYLDELHPDTGRNQMEILDDCGAMCELMKI